MTFSVLNQGGIMLFRWAHFIFGIIWIGMLYYFNFVHTPFMAEADAAAKPSVVTKLLPRGLWWFRFGALFTWISGLILLYLSTLTPEGANMHLFATAWGMNIMIGAVLGTIMMLNVWLIIWPKQQIVIGSANAVATGGQANPAVPAAAARGGVASRTNTLFSIPLLFFMGAASHLQVQVRDDVSFWPLIIVLGIIILAIEANAIWGKLVGPLKTVKGVIHAGLALTVVFYLLVEFLTK